MKKRKFNFRLSTGKNQGGEIPFQDQNKEKYEAVYDKGSKTPTVNSMLYKQILRYRIANLMSRTG